MHFQRDIDSKRLGDTPYILRGVHTHTVRQALREMSDVSAIADLLFLEAWEMGPMASVAATLRAAQIRRANPELAGQIRFEAQRIRANSFAHTAALDAASVQFPSVPEEAATESPETFHGASSVAY